MRRLLPMVLLLAFAPLALAHGDLSMRIAILDDQIKSHPRAAELYLQRTQLRQQHGEWAGALADLKQARRLDPKLAPFAVLEAQVLLDAKQPKAAIEAVEAFAKTHPKHGPAWWALGRARAQVKDAKGAADALDMAVALMNPLLPDHVLAGAEAQVALHQPEEAIKRLDRGMQRLGPLVVLQERALALEIDMGRPQLALNRLDAIIGQMKARKLNPAVWEKQRVEIQATLAK